MRLRDKVALAALGMTLLCAAIIIAGSEVFIVSQPEPSVSVNVFEALSPSNNRLILLPAFALLVGYVGDYLSS